MVSVREQRENQDLGLPSDYGQELDGQKARKAAKEFEWSGRHQEFSDEQLKLVVKRLEFETMYGMSRKLRLEVLKDLLTSFKRGV